MFSRNEIIKILKSNGDDNRLFLLADRIRKKYVKDEIHLRGLIEFSNICKCSCKYCGLQSVNKNVERYRMMPSDIIKCAKKACDAGYKTIVLQSGEDNFYTKEIMCEIISEIKKLKTAITLSIGEKTYDELLAYKKAGADRYLLRIETTDKNLYKKMHPNMNFENRIMCLKNLKEIGYEVGTGCLVGLPGQNIESLADDILFFKEINADMIGIGPFIPHPNTPLKKANTGDFYLSLKVMALARILLKDINIPATTAMETLHPNGRLIALQSGANVIMPNVTDTKYREKYEIYPNKTCITETIEHCRKCTEEKVYSIGRTISKDFGYRKCNN